MVQEIKVTYHRKSETKMINSKCCESLMHTSSKFSRLDYHASDLFIFFYFVKHITSCWHSSRGGMSEEQEMVGGGGDGRVRVEWGGKNISFCSSPEGTRYVEAVGRGEQVHGNSEIIAYAWCSDSYSKLWLEEKIMLKRDGKQWM